MQRFSKLFMAATVGLALTLGLILPATHAQTPPDEVGPVRLLSRTFTPAAGVEQPLASRLAERSTGRQHILVQLHTIPTEADRAALAEAGVKLLDYIPDNAWFATVSRQLDLSQSQYHLIYWAGSILPADKIAPALQQNNTGSRAADTDGAVTLQLLFFNDVTTNEASALINRLQGTVQQSNVAGIYQVQFPNQQVIQSLADHDIVQWIDKAPSPIHLRHARSQQITPRNDGARDRTRVNILQTAHPDANGAGTRLGVWDGGVDPNHPDFQGRLTVDPNHGDPASSHGTHVAGTMAGDGSNSVNHNGTANQWRGIATAAQIYSYDNNVNKNGDDWFTSHKNGIQTDKIDLSQNSWGGDFSADKCDTHNLYSIDARLMDQVVTGEAYGRGIVSVVAASNFREGQSDKNEDPFPICNFNQGPDFLNYTSLSDLGSAKNILSVGATQKIETDRMADFSSWGPTRDGRLKPDIVAPGHEINSAQPGGGYKLESGTSMAAPHISGIAALVIQRYRTVFKTQTIQPATIKAILLQTARDLNNNHVYYKPGPDYASGYGIADANAAYEIISPDRVQTNQVSNGTTQRYTLTVSTAATPLKVTIAWDDPVGVLNANQQLVNDLDLVLIAPDGTTRHLPWLLDPTKPDEAAKTGVDKLNNVEQVSVQNPTVGVWTIQVNGSRVPKGPQGYALVSNINVGKDSGNNGGNGPANDNLANAVDVTNQLPFTGTVDISNATRETNESLCVDNDGGQDTHSVWYKLTPTQAGKVTVTATPANGVDATLGLFSGTGHPLTQITCVNDKNKNGTETISQQAVTAKTSYWVRVAGFNGSSGNITVNITFTPDALTPTPTATAVPSETVTPIPTATAVPSETVTPIPTATAVPSETVTPIPTATAVPSETVTPIPTATAVPSETVTPIPTATAVPSETVTPPNLMNDDLADAVDVTNQLPFTGTVDISNATLETNESLCVDNDKGLDLNSAWYKLTPSQAGKLSVTANPDSGVNTTLGLFSGMEHPLTKITCVDEGVDEESETISEQDVTADTDYWVRVAGSSTDARQISASGRITVNISFQQTQKNIYLPLVIK